MIAVGDQLPDFSLLNEGEETVTRDDLLGGKYILYFYPKDLTPGCTNEAICFDAVLDDFKALGYQVFGCNRDLPTTHRKFIDRYHLRFSLLSDPEAAFIRRMGLWQEKKNFGKTYYGVARSTYVVDEQGTVTHAYHRVKPVGHAQAVLADLR